MKLVYGTHGITFLIFIPWNFFTFPIEVLSMFDIFYARQVTGSVFQFPDLEYSFKSFNKELFGIHRNI